MCFVSGKTFCCDSEFVHKTFLPFVFYFDLPVPLPLNAHRAAAAAGVLQLHLEAKFALQNGVEFIHSYARRARPTTPN